MVVGPIRTGFCGSLGHFRCHITFITITSVCVRESFPVKLRVHPVCASRHHAKSQTHEILYHSMLSVCVCVFDRENTHVFSTACVPYEGWETLPLSLPGMWWQQHQQQRQQHCTRGQNFAHFITSSSVLQTKLLEYTICERRRGKGWV